MEQEADIVGRRVEKHTKLREAKRGIERDPILCLSAHQPVSSAAGRAQMELDNPRLPSIMNPLYANRAELFDKVRVKTRNLFNDLYW